MYKLLVRPILFLFQPETIHHFSVIFLRITFAIPGINGLMRKIFQVKKPQLKRTLFGLDFDNPIGLAAGFDKDAQMIKPMAAFGFGFIEIGTLTPLPQPGNPKPRIFRLIKDKALINRMGFNNRGVDGAIEKLKKNKTKVIIGGNIGKNKVTPNEDAVSDYEIAFKKLFPYVDYFVVNVSSPNTPNLRELQEKEPLKQLLSHLQGLNSGADRKPLLLKIAPDLEIPQLNDIVEIVSETALDGIVATNTTISRAGLSANPDHVKSLGAGGLSGAPLTQASTNMIKYLREHLPPDFPIVAVGGIMNEKDAIEKLKAGADLIQLYTGFVYEGPALVKRINKAILNEI